MKRNHKKIPKLTKKRGNIGEAAVGRGERWKEN